MLKGSASLAEYATAHRPAPQTHRKAIELCGRALGIFEQRIGKDNPELTWSLNCLAGAYTDLGESAKAIPQLRRAIKVQGSESGNPDCSPQASSS